MNAPPHPIRTAFLFLMFASGKERGAWFSKRWRSTEMEVASCDTGPCHLGKKKRGAWPQPSLMVAFVFQRILQKGSAKKGAAFFRNFQLPSSQRPSWPASRKRAWLTILLVAMIAANLLRWKKLPWSWAAWISMRLGSAGPTRRPSCFWNGRFLPFLARGMILWSTMPVKRESPRPWDRCSLQWIQLLSVLCPWSQAGFAGIALRISYDPGPCTFDFASSSGFLRGPPHQEHVWSPSCPEVLGRPCVRPPAPKWERSLSLPFVAILFVYPYLLAGTGNNLEILPCLPRTA